MTEHNLFCYSREFGNEWSFQQPRWRAFNEVVGRDRYYAILELVRKIIPNPNNLNLDDFWKSVSQSQWRQLLDIPEAKGFKEGFEYISGVKIGCREIIIDGKSIKISEESFQELKNQLK